MTDYNEILELSAECEELRSELSSDLASAREMAQAATSEAREAERQADEAASSADSADDRCCEAQDTLGRLSGKLAELEAAIKTLDPDKPADATSSSLEADIRRHNDRVMAHLKAGHSVAKIATAFKLSETLVDMIRRRNSVAA